MQQSILKSSIIDLQMISLLLFPAALFALFYYPAVTKFSRGLVSPYAKADVGRRLSAAIVDGLLIATAWFVYQRSESLAPLIAGAAYLVLRDAVHGRSFGKFMFGLVVINLETGKPCTRATAIRRNLVFLVPGANIVAVLLEGITILRDAQGQRLGDRIAQTQVVDGFGARDVAPAFYRWWTAALGEMTADPRHPERLPEKVA